MGTIVALLGLIAFIWVIIKANTPTPTVKKIDKIHTDVHVEQNMRRVVKPLSNFDSWKEEKEEGIDILKTYTEMGWKKPPKTQRGKENYVKRVIKKTQSHIDPKGWFIAEKHKDTAPSPAERKILTELNKWNVEYYREVSFLGLKSDKGGYLRFDFYFPQLCMMIEYDGQLAHSTDEQLQNDQLKTNFCNLYGFDLVRYDKRHYHQMEEYLWALLHRKGIKKRPSA